MTRRRFNWVQRVVVLAFVCGVAVPAAFGQKANTKDAQPGEKQTGPDPTIPIDELTLSLRPLTKAELDTEAKAWIDLLRAKAGEIADKEIDVKHTNAEISKAKEEKAAAEAKAKEEAQARAKAEADAKAEAETSGQQEPAAEPEPVQEETKTAEQQQAERQLEDQRGNKVKAIDSLVALREQRSKIIDRTNLVIAELKKKGGDTAEYEAYVNNVVDVITIDVADTGATWLAITGWFKSEEGGIRWAMNIVWFVVTIIGFWIVGRIASGAVRRALRLTRGVSDLLRDFLVKSTRRAIMLIGLIVALAQLEVNIGPLMAAIGAAGFVIAFALQGTLSNFASGLLILIYRPYDVGHVVNVAGVSGVVKSMNLLSTIISTFDNQTVIVPNNSIWGDTITNVTGNETRRVDMVFGIGYGDDAEKARGTIESVLSAHPLVLDNPEPVVRLHELADSSVNLICRPWTKTADYWTVYWDVTKSVKDRFDAEGISIPFPQRDVHLHTVEAGTP